MSCLQWDRHRDRQAVPGAELLSRVGSCVMLSVYDPHILIPLAIYHPESEVDGLFTHAYPPFSTCSLCVNVMTCIVLSPAVPGPITLPLLLLPSLSLSPSTSIYMNQACVWAYSRSGLCIFLIAKSLGLICIHMCPSVLVLVCIVMFV